MSEQGPQDKERKAPRKHLWFTQDRSRFFLVPHDLTLPPGDFVVRSLQAVRTGLLEEGLQAYEIDSATARAHIDAGWEGAVGPVVEAWRDLLGTKAEQEADAQSSAPQPASQALFDWLGVSPGELVTDPEKARMARKNLVERAAGLVGAELTVDQVSRFEASLDRIGAAVVRDAERLRTGTSDLADEIEARRPQIEATLESTGESLIEIGRDAFSRLKELGRGPRSTSASEDETAPDVVAEDAEERDAEERDAEERTPTNRDGNKL